MTSFNPIEKIKEVLKSLEEVKSRWVCFKHSIWHIGLTKEDDNTLSIYKIKNNNDVEELDILENIPKYIIDYHGVIMEDEYIKNKYPLIILGLPEWQDDDNFTPTVLHELIHIYQTKRFSNYMDKFLFKLPEHDEVFYKVLKNKYSEIIPLYNDFFKSIKEKNITKMSDIRKDLKNLLKEDMYKFFCLKEFLEGSARYYEFKARKLLNYPVWHQNKLLTMPDVIYISGYLVCEYLEEKDQLDINKLYTISDFLYNLSC